MYAFRGATHSAICRLFLKRFDARSLTLLVNRPFCHSPCHSFNFLRVPQFPKLYSTMETSDIPSKEELLKKLTPLQYHVTQEKGTERPFTGEYNKLYDEGSYSCIVCGQYLFSSNTKYDSGCGWPAFNDVLEKGRIKLLPDTSGGRIRTEVQCSKCSAHLGHVFEDGPKPTGKRYCINSASISFHPAEKK